MIPDPSTAASPPPPPQPHTLVLSVGCGHDGRLGHGTDRNESIPRPILFFQNKGIVRRVFAGGYHSFFMTDEFVYATGYGEEGQLGIGSRMSYKLPQLVKDLNPSVVADISLGRYHSVALYNNGTVWTCGENKNGQLGHGDHDPRVRFNQVDAFEGRRVHAISAGGYHTVFAVRSEEEGVNALEVFTCGKGDFGELGYNADAIHSMKRVENRVKATNWSSESVQDSMAFRTSYNNAVSGGKKSSKAPTIQRRLEVDCSTPRQVTIPYTLDVSSTTIYAGLHHTIVSCPPFTFHFGCRYDGVPETDASSIPTPLLLNEDSAVPPRSTACGDDVMVCVCEDGLYAQGKGMLGDGNVREEHTQSTQWVRCSVPPTAENTALIQSKTSRVSGCDKYFYIWEAGGQRILCFGDNYTGQCGNGDEIDVVTPTCVQLPAGVKVLDVSVGVRHAIILCEKIA
eukprot:PhF_6_TR5594/c0_g1_i1/m.8034